MPKKPLTLTVRDKALLNDLREYGLHPTKRLAASHFPGVNTCTVLRRLRLLEQHKLIQRVPDLDGIGAAWGLSKAGGKFFTDEPTKINFPRFIQDHDLKLANLRLTLEAAGIARAWRPEHVIRAKVARRGRNALQRYHVPDGLMGVDVSGFREAVAIELELTPKNQERYGNIFSDYRLKEKLWGVWYVVAKPTLGKQLESARAKTTKRERPYFFWSLLEDVMNDPLRAEAHGKEGTFRVKDLWAPFAADNQHSPAQGMSTLEAETAASAHDLTSENNL